LQKKGYSTAIPDIKKAGRKDQPAFRPAIPATPRPSPQFIVSTTAFILEYRLQPYHSEEEPERCCFSTQKEQHSTNQPHIQNISYY